MIIGFPVMTDPCISTVRSPSLYSECAGSFHCRPDQEHGSCTRQDLPWALVVPAVLECHSFQGGPVKVQKGLSTSPIVILSHTQTPSGHQLLQLSVLLEGKGFSKMEDVLTALSSLLGIQWRSHPGPMYNDACGPPSAE